MCFIASIQSNCAVPSYHNLQNPVKMLGLFYFIFLLGLGGLDIPKSDAAECESGWTAYKDETCIKSFTGFLTYNNAKEFCASQGNGVATASLLMIKEAAMQEFVAEYTKELYDNLWIGGKYNNETSRFEWEDGEAVEFTNWAEGYPRNNTNSETCIQLRPVNAKRENGLEGKWEDTACERSNLPLCQRTLTWTLEDATREIVNLRKEFQAAKEDHALTKQRLDETKQDLEASKSEAKANYTATIALVVPVGSIYIEYYNQPAPTTLWPTMTWQDITGTYAGLFFRAYGGNSGSWGTQQPECSPRISRAEWNYWVDDAHNAIDFPKNGWSLAVRSGFYDNPPPNSWLDTIRFNVADCEVRPNNQAIRIWKRSA